MGEAYTPFEHVRVGGRYRLTHRTRGTFGVVVRFKETKLEGVGAVPPNYTVEVVAGCTLLNGRPSLGVGALLNLDAADCRLVDLEVQS